MTGIRSFCAILIGEMKALELMKTHVVKTSPGATLAQAIDLMDLYYVTGLPVVDDQDCICGLLTDADVLRATIDAAKDALCCDSVTRTFLLSARQAGDRLVGDYMQRSIITVSEHDDVSAVMPVLFKGAIDRVPVLDVSRRVVGMLHRIDIIQALFEGMFV